MSLPAKCCWSFLDFRMMAFSCNHTSEKIFMAVFDESVTFDSNILKVSLLGKVIVIRKVSLSITLPKQLVLV